MKKDYGNPAVVTHLKLKNLFDKPQINPNDRTALRRYHQQLKSTITWLQIMGYQSSVSSIENLTKAVTRLPNKLRYSFYKYSKDSLSCEGSMSLKDFEMWLDSILRQYFNPLADIIASKDNNKNNKDRKERERTEKITTLNGTSKEIKCWLCQKNHKKWNCEEFKSKPVEEK